MPNEITVLLVDDEPAMLLIHQRFLSRSFPGAIVLTAASVADALVVLRFVRVDLVVCDFNLPDGTGDAVLDRCREIGMADRFCFLTGNSDVLGSHQHVLIKGDPTESARDYLTSMLRNATV